MIIAFPGSFDPLTNGHINIIERAAAIADHIYVVVENNHSKQYLFSDEERVSFCRDYFRGNEKVTVESHQGMTVDFCSEHGVDVIVRGVRNSTDLEYEKAIAAYNRDLSGIETMFLYTEPALEHVSSSGVRELMKYNRDISEYVPEVVSQYSKNNK